LLLIVAILAYGATLRSCRLGYAPLWTDEAETSINALTILEYSVPVDQYLGVAMFENALTVPWPDSPEYEFRDSSYSSRGLGIYHGSLPLYLTAASFALNGIQPDTSTDPLTVQHNPEEIYRRTVPARIPAVASGMLFLVAIFIAGQALYGEDAG
jgi:hypothetical protein